MKGPGGMSAIGRRVAIFILGGLWVPATAGRPAEVALGIVSPDGWQAYAPRAEIAPRMEVRTGAGANGVRLVTRHGQGGGQQGWWRKTFPVQPGTWYRFSVLRRVESLASPRRHVLVRIEWQNARGGRVDRPAPVVAWYHPNSPVRAEPEYPVDRSKSKDDWVEVAGIYQAPPEAATAIVRLESRWGAGYEVTWRQVRWEPTTAPPARRVRLAAVHYRPKGRSAKANREEFAPLIAQAAARKADLVVLPEVITYYGTGQSYAACAEPIPGPSTDYFGQLARRHGVHIVVGLVERDGPFVYNVAVLIGPDGQMIGKYRKVCLPRGEADAGIRPGRDYPVFDTKLGRIGLMVCYDGFFPEVARQLAARGAEIIAFPVWGCHPMLARARAVENQVYIVSSTYTPRDHRWIISGIIDPSGKIVAAAERFGEVVVAEVDLSRPFYWSSLGDFRAELHRHRP